MVGMREKRRQVGRKEESFRFGRMISYKFFFIVILWVPQCCSLLFRCCLQVWLVVLLSSYNFLHGLKFWQWYVLDEILLITPYLFVMLHSPFLRCFWNSFILVLQNMVYSLRWIPPYCSFSFTIFASLSGDIIVILQPIALLQASLMTCFKLALLCHVAFVVVLPCFHRNP
jgi:hypothetical protein